MINVTSVASEPYTGSSILVKIAVRGVFNQVKDGLIFGAAALLALLILIFIVVMCNLCLNRPTLMKYEDWNYRDTIPAL